MELFVGLIILLTFSAFFSGSETAIFHLNKGEMERVGRRYSLLKERHKLLTTLLLGNTLVNIGASIIGAKLFHKWGKVEGIGIIITLIMTYLILVFGEFSPKLYALKNSEKIASISLKLLSKIYFFFLPLTWMINRVVEKVTPLKRKVSSEDLKMLLEYEMEERVISPLEMEFVSNLIEFKNVKVEDIMTKREKIEALPYSKELNKKEIAKLNHSRIPVYKGEIDEIVGILYLKDTLLKNDGVKIKKLLRQPYFLSKEISAREALRFFQEKGVHIGIVRENNKVVGVITLDDIFKRLILKV
jgi:CBS domain containing-hemolysin-like protein